MHLINFFIVWDLRNLCVILGREKCAPEWKKIRIIKSRFRPNQGFQFSRPRCWTTIRQRGCLDTTFLCCSFFWRVFSSVTVSLQTYFKKKKKNSSSTSLNPSSCTCSGNWSIIIMLIFSFGFSLFLAFCLRVLFIAIFPRRFFKILSSIPFAAIASLRLFCRCSLLMFCE